MKFRDEAVKATDVATDDTLVSEHGHVGRVFTRSVLPNGVTVFTCANMSGKFFGVAVEAGGTVTRRVYPERF